MYMVIIFIVVILVSILVTFVSGRMSRKRSENIEPEARRLGLDYYRHDPYAIGFRYRYLDPLRLGFKAQASLEGREGGGYATNVINGSYQGHRVLLFDYCYQSPGGHEHGGREDDFSAAILQLADHFPETVLYPEGFLDKVKQGMGFEDLDFENEEFSRKFVVKSTDPRYARDIFHSGMMELLLSMEGDISFEAERDTVLFYFHKNLKVEELEAKLDQFVAIKEQFPQYVFEEGENPYGSGAAYCPQCGRDDRYRLPVPSVEIQGMIERMSGKMWQSPMGQSLLEATIGPIRPYLEMDGNDCTACAPYYW